MEQKKKIYIAGKVTGLQIDEVLKKSVDAERELRKSGAITMNHAYNVFNAGFEHGDYMHISFAMIDVCDAVYLLKDWQKSKGARMELQYAADHQKEIIYEDESTREENFPIMYAHPKD